MSRCPKCDHSFKDGPGFCPYDGRKVDERTHCGLTGTQRWPGYEKYVGMVPDGRYDVGEIIGQGGMGVVYKAKHRIIERDLAIKILPKEIGREKNIVHRFIREAKSASRISHMNIVEVTDFGQTDDGLPYFVMEYVDGPSLREVLAGKAPLEVDQIRFIVGQIASALEAAHVQGVAHRDLKPDNIFLTQKKGRPDFVKIVDFGIAKVIDVTTDAKLRKLTRAGNVFGTPEYMSPEQAAGRDDVDQRADVYALGLLLYEMLMGKVPLRGDNPQQTIAMQILDEIETPTKRPDGTDIPTNLQEALSLSLVKDRDKRMKTMKHFADLVDGDIDRLPARRVTDPGLPEKKPNVALWAVVVSAVVLAGVAVYVLVGAQDGGKKKQAANKGRVFDAAPALPPSQVKVVATPTSVLQVGDKALGQGSAVVNVGDDPVRVTCTDPEYLVDGEVVLLRDMESVECRPKCHRKIKDPFDKDCPN